MHSLRKQKSHADFEKVEERGNSVLKQMKNNVDELSKAKKIIFLQLKKAESLKIIIL